MRKISITTVSMLFMWFALSTTALAQGLKKAEAEKARQEVVEKWIEEIRLQTDYITTQGAITRNGKTMKLLCRKFGEIPQDGYALFISLHGGGNTATQVNDSQWQNQVMLYEPAGAIYACPRAPYDDWDMHFKPGLDEFYQDLIHYAVSHLGVNANKVYIMGYSAGGDGVWRLAPRMADTWAAASMMAGHPGDVGLLNLRNTPFMIWCGAQDAAYDRNKQCAQRGLEMDSLQKATPDGYIHETHIVSGKPHWMDQVDTVAVSWMAQYKRNPYPTDIVWRQEEVLHDQFYYISVPQQEMQRGREVRLSVKGNTITIGKCDYSQLTLGLTDELLNLDKPITVYLNGKRIMKQKVQRSQAVMEKWIRQKGDENYACPAELVINTKTN